MTSDCTDFNASSKTWVQNPVFSWINKHLPQNNMTDSVLINMSEQHIDAIIKIINNKIQKNKTNIKFDKNIFSRFIEEIKLIKTELIPAVTNENALITGYYKENSSGSPIILGLTYLITAYYNDNFKLDFIKYSGNNSHFKISENGKTVSIVQKNLQACLDPHGIFIKDVINTKNGNQFIMKARWYNKLTGNKVKSEGICLGCFVAPTVDQIEQARINWNCAWNDSGVFYKQLIAKPFEGNDAIQYDPINETTIYFPCNSVIPANLTESIWKLIIDFNCKTITIHLNGIQIIKLKIALALYITPIFGLIAENCDGDSLQLLEAYLC